MLIGVVRAHGAYYINNVLSLRLRVISLVVDSVGGPPTPRSLLSNQGGVHTTSPPAAIYVILVHLIPCSLGVAVGHRCCGHPLGGAVGQDVDRWYTSIFAGVQV